jgi:hypothetical protein
MWERSCRVPLVAADLVHGALDETHDVDGSKQISASDRLV